MAIVNAENGPRVPKKLAVRRLRARGPPTRDMPVAIEKIAVLRAKPTA